MDSHCNRVGCQEIGTHQVWLEFYQAAGLLYEGAPAQLFFPDLVFCETHASAMTQHDLIFEDQVAGMFRSLGRVAPDFSRTQVRSRVIQPEGAVV